MPSFPTSLRIDEVASSAPHAGGEVAMCEPDGTPTAYSGTEHGRLWVHVPGVATFSWADGEEELAARPEPSVGGERVADAYRTVAVPLFHQALGWESLHGSAVVVDERVVALCAASGTGKSTTAYGLARRGMALWADDVVLLETRPGAAPRCRAVPFAFHLRPESRRMLGADEDLADVAYAQDAERDLGAVVVLGRHDGAGGPAAERLPVAAALAEVLPHGYRFGLADDDRRRTTIEHYLALVAVVPVLRVRFAPGWDGFGALLDTVEAAVAEALR